MRFSSYITGCALLIACGYATAQPTSDVEFIPCRIGEAQNQLAAECATVRVPFTHGLAVDSNTTSSALIPEFMELAVARIPARERQPAADPITVIAGGPGQSARDSWPQLAAAFRPALAHRDVYLIDQRGTGASTRLNCPTPTEPASMSIDIDQTRAMAAACFESIEQPVEWFTTSVAVRDLDVVRERLGLTTWNVYGVSYGTRVALHYLRRYPSSVSSLILDAVVPPTKALGPEIPLHAQSALDALFSRCANALQ